MAEWITLDKVDIAWAAGFFDGEGCIRINKAKNQYRLQILVRQVDVRPIKKLVSLFGGTYSKYDWNGYSSKHRPIYTWHLPGKRAVPVLNALYPYLVNKKEQAYIAIIFQAQIKPLGTYGKGKARLTDAERAFREDCYVKLKELKWQK